MKDKRYLYILIAIEGFLVTGIEISSAFILKPYFGNSLEVWTVILGITMLSLTLGYLLGSWISSKEDKIFKYAFINLILLVLFVFLIPFTSTYFFRAKLDYELINILLISVISFLLPPLVLLGSLSTILVHLIQKTGLKSGVSASLTYALSTLFGVSSLLFISFFLIDQMNSYFIFFILFLISLIALIIFSFVFYKRKNLVVIFLTSIFLTAFYFTEGLENNKDLYVNNFKIEYENNATLGKVMVIKDFKNRTKMLLVNNNIQTTTDFSTNGNYFHIKRITDFLKTSNIQGDVLIAGLGAGSLTKELIKTQKKVDVIEIDKRMISVSENYFNLPHSKKINYVVDDARRYINANTKKYDVIVLDLSIGETVPSNVYTIECFRKIKTSLKPNGILMLNFFTKSSKNGLLALSSICKTLNTAGLRVRLLNNLSQKNQLECVVVYANNTLKYKAIEDSICQTYDFSKGFILNDDNSKLDLIHKEIVFEQRMNFIKNYQMIQEYLKNLN